ncbi:MAG: LCP family protein [Armatimonadetes bacterium]|nr:LCP family protein [Armatimonadota bacterium]
MRPRPRRLTFRARLLLVLAAAAPSVLLGMHSAGLRLPTVAAGLLQRHSAPPPNPFGHAEVNLLVIGTDRSDPTGWADSVQLVALDLAHGTSAVLGLPRDTLGRAADGSGGRLADAWRAGGPPAVAQVAANVLNVGIDHWLKLDFAGLAALVDQVGGAELMIDRPLRYTDRAQGLSINLSAGWQRLNGAQAMQLAVARAGASPQQARRVVRDLPSLARLVQTSMSTAQLVRLAGLLSELDPSRMPMTTLPGQTVHDGGRSWFAPGAGAATLVPALRSEIARPAALPLVTIYNGSDRVGLERVVARKLERAGYRALVGNPLPVAPAPRTIMYSLDDATATGPVDKLIGGVVTPGLPPQGLSSRWPEAVAGYGRVVMVLGVDCPGG